MLLEDYADVPPPAEQLRRYAEARARLVQTAKPDEVIDVPQFLPSPAEIAKLFAALASPHIPYQPDSGFTPAPRRITMRAILSAVSHEFCVSIAELKGPRRHRVLVEPRQVAMWIARHCTALSYPHIGATLGDRDHQTILHGSRRIAQAVADGTELGARALTVRARLEEEHGFGGEAP